MFILKDALYLNHDRVNLDILQKQFEFLKGIMVYSHNWYYMIMLNILW